MPQEVTDDRGMQLCPSACYAECVAQAVETPGRSNLGWASLKVFEPGHILVVRFFLRLPRCTYPLLERRDLVLMTRAVVVQPGLEASALEH
ncbi:MAG: hypothetical protein ACYCVE_09155, partial [Gemmatimonadaceae bacterium]